MARISASPSPYVRLRRRPDDDRLYVTSNGSTEAGYLAEASIQYSVGDVPLLHFELEEHPSDLYGDGIDAARHDISVDRILLHDLQELSKSVRSHEHPFHALLKVLDQVRPYLSEAMPPCGHEDVIDTSTLGDATSRGMCVWCPVDMILLNDEWMPSS
ncbi:hypothetical protein [Streptomyces sp. NBC_00878]|uniref:hypothetical protein n=1 Tax=Streptomyces sp. NBC_00878 TaxID=2975854 RepID=UPI00224FEFEF|nr:hypothetical protein [Streptomyces sp. NBC_00878]MCX4911858.1 hypothetical protein [Streptomyces sp. NBC_00878]